MVADVLTYDGLREVRYCAPMIVASDPRPHTSPTNPADRATRLYAAMLCGYLVVMLWSMWGYVRSTGDASPLLMHCGALAVALVSLAAPWRATRAVRDWLPLALGPFLYIELRWLVPGAGRPYRDLLVQGWELSLFGGQPSTTWAPAMPSVVLSELLHFCYASYYLLVYLPPLLLYLRGHREGFARTMLALTFVYGSCFTAYLFFPVEGPRFIVGPAAAPEGPIRSFVLHLLAAGSSRGTAFPSSHIAASVVAALCALHFQRGVGAIVALLTLGLALGTVYGGFHYAVDGIAGVAVGVAAWVLAEVAWRRLSRRGEQSATAA
jgi:membrane-associated phospholipid phosphatase